MLVAAPCPSHDIDESAVVPAGNSSCAVPNGLESGLDSCQPLPGHSEMLAFSAIYRSNGRRVEVRILPWAHKPAVRVQLERQVRLLQAVAPSDFRELLQLDLQSSPPQLIMDSAGHRLDRMISALSASQRLQFAVQIIRIVERSMLGGLVHNILTAASIFIYDNDQIKVDYLERFYTPIAYDSDPALDADARAAVRLVQELLEPTIDCADLCDSLSGHQRGRLRSLLREEPQPGIELDVFERWSTLLKSLEDTVLTPEIANDPSLRLNSTFLAHDTTCDTCEIDVDLVASSQFYMSSDDKTSEIEVTTPRIPSYTGPMPNCGDVLGRFRLDTILGEGGMGTVYRGTDLGTQTDVAVKVLRPTGSDTGQAVRRFNKEARLLQSIQNDFVTQLLDSGFDHGYHYLAMEFVDGINLKDWIRSRLPLDEALALTIIADVARALIDAHERDIVHRDIKPENILLRRLERSDTNASELEIDHFRIKLSDFGIARVIDQSASLDMTRVGSMVGTPTYMAPEQCKGNGSISPASDIYALGVTLYYLLCGQPPFEAEDALKMAAMHCFDPPMDIRKRNPQVSLATATLIGSMLAKQPVDRPTDAAQLVGEIEQILRGEANDATLHPLMPKHSDALWERCFSWDLRSSPDLLWPYVSNTDRLHRAADLRAANYRMEKHPTLGLRKLGSFRLAGMRIEWEEHPFEWVEGRRMGVLREFPSGPFRWLMSIVDLSRLPDGGTRLTHTIRIEPRHRLGRVIAAFEAGRKRGRALDRVYRRIDRSLQQERPNPLHDPFEPSTSLNSARSGRIVQCMKRMARHGVPLQSASKLTEYVRHAPPRVLSKLRPLDLANQLGIPSKEMIDICLVAAHCGLLQVRWDILCPTCQAPASTVALLSQIAQHQTCEACDTNFQANVANAIELAFRAHPDVSPIDDNQYCVGGPEYSPHVVSQLRLQPNERIEVTVPLGTGDYLVRGLGLHQTVALRVRSQATPSSLDLRLGQLAHLRETRDIRAGDLRLALVNDLPAPQVVRLERVVDRTNVVTAALASALPRFRDLFPDQLFRKENTIAADEFTLVATRIATTEQFYAARSDAEAFLVLQQAQNVIEGCVTAFQGAVIKTAGEVLLASFQDSAAATLAALSISQRLQEQPGLSELVTATAVHRGSLLVTTQNGRLDYFGTTVRQVQSLCDQIDAGIAITDAVFTDVSVQHNLAASVRAYHSVYRTFNLPGSPQRIVQQIVFDDWNTR